MANFDIVNLSHDQKEEISRRYFLRRSDPTKGSFLKSRSDAALMICERKPKRPSGLARKNSTACRSTIKRPRHWRPLSRPFCDMPWFSPANSAGAGLWNISLLDSYAQC